MPRHVLLLALVLLGASAASALPLPASAPGPAPKALQDDCRTGADVADGPDGARLLADGERCSGRLGPDDAADWFAVHADVGRVVAFSATGGTVLDAYEVCAREPDGDAAGCFARSSTGAAVRLRVREAGAWTFGVSAANDATGPWSVRGVAEGPFVWNDCASGDDAPDAGGLALTLPVACAGEISRDGLDVLDRYAFEVPAGHRVRLEARPGAMFSPFGFCLASPTDEQCTSQFGAVVLYGEPTVAGTWTLQASGARMTYSFDLRHEPIPAPDDCGSGLDAGADAAGALVVALPATCRASFEPGTADAVDVFAFDVAAGEVLTIDPRTGGNAHACLLAPTGESMACSTGYHPYALPFVAQAPFAGRYHVRVESLRPWMFYELHADVQAAGGATQDDCGAGRDAGEHPGDALALAMGASCRADVLDTLADKSDWYALPLAAGDSVVVSVEEEGAYTLARVCAFAPGEATPRACHDRGVPGAKQLELHAERAGVWSLRVMRDGGSEYALSVAPGALQDDCGAGRDAGPAPHTAVAVGPAEACGAAFPPLLADHEDWYAVTATAGALVAAQWVMQPFFTMEACIHAPDGAQVACSRDGRVSAPADAAGQWLVVARRVTGSGAYELTLGAA